MFIRASSTLDYVSVHEKDMAGAIVAYQTFWESCVLKEMWLLLASLSSRLGWPIIHPDTVQTALKDRTYKVMLVFDVPWVVAYNKAAWTDSGTKCILYIDDVHWFRIGVRVEKDLACRNADVILCTNSHRLQDFFPCVRYSPKVKNLPHSAIDSCVLDINPSPENTVLLCGRTSHNVCALRRAALRARNADPNLPLTVLDHPGYDQIDPNALVGEAFYKKIRNHIAAITCGTVFRYITAKHYEIPAAGALLITHDIMVPELTRVGFVEGLHYISTSSDKVKDALLWATDPSNRERVDKMRAACRDLVIRRHLLSHRIDRAERMIRET